jgi:Arc/MetJ-type ribon-helix-helix transcriptional regulator
MNLSLAPETERLIHERMKSGQYQTPDDVVAAAIAALDREERSEGPGDFAPGELDELIAEGEADIARGDVLDGDEVFALRRARRAQNR